MCSLCNCSTSRLGFMAFRRISCPRVTPSESDRPRNGETGTRERFRKTCPALSYWGRHRRLSVQFIRRHTPQRRVSRTSCLIIITWIVTFEGDYDISFLLRNQQLVRIRVPPPGNPRKPASILSANRFTASSPKIVPAIPPAIVIPACHARRDARV
jgi:hypothetical protein